MLNICYFLTNFKINKVRLKPKIKINKKIKKYKNNRKIKKNKQLVKNWVLKKKDIKLYKLKPNKQQISKR